MVALGVWFGDQTPQKEKQLQKNIKNKLIFIDIR